MEKGAAASRTDLHLGVDHSRAASFDLVAELSGSTRGFSFRCHPVLYFFVTVLAVMTCWYGESTGELTMDSWVTATLKQNDTSLYDSVANETEFIANAERTHLEEYEKMEATLARLSEILGEIDMKIEGRDSLETAARQTESVSVGVGNPGERDGSGSDSESSTAPIVDSPITDVDGSSSTKAPLPARKVARTAAAPMDLLVMQH